MYNPISLLKRFGSSGHIKVWACCLGALLLVSCASTTKRMDARWPKQQAGQASVEAARHMAQLMRAEWMLGNDDLPMAASVYATLVTRLDDADALRQAIEVSLAVNDVPTAKRALARLVSHGDGDAVEIEAYRVRLALAARQLVQARRYARQLIERHTLDAWQWVARVLLAARDSSDATTLFVDIYPTFQSAQDAAALLLMSDVASELGLDNKAYALAKSALDRFSCEACYLKMAQLTYDNGDKPVALEVMHQGVRQFPQATPMRLVYASMLHDSGEIDKIEPMLSKGKQDLALFKARAFYANQSDNKALEAVVYRQMQAAALEHQEDYAYTLGQLAMDLDEDDQALAYFAKVGDEDSNYFDAGMRSAYLYVQRQQWGKARDQLQRLRIDVTGQPDMVMQTLLMEGRFYMQNKDFRQAADIYSSGLDTLPDNAELLYGRGLAYAELGKTDKAIADLRYLLSLEPDDVEVMNALGYTLADSGRDLPEAEALIRKAYQAKPENIAIIDSMGWLNYRLGNLADAEHYLRKAWRKTDKDAEIGLHLLEVLWRRHKRQQARQVYHQLEQLVVHQDKLKLQQLHKRLDL